MTIDKIDFDKFLKSVNACYAKEVFQKLPSINDFRDLIQGDKIDYGILRSYSEGHPNIYFRSALRRILALVNIKYSRMNGGKFFDLADNWNLVFNSILEIPISSTISSIGSQGFLSIPLFKFQNDKGDFEFIRLHIWDKTLFQYINEYAFQNFSIHSHLFYARSWIICGRVINDRYNVEQTKDSSKNSLFVIAYNETINEVNQHTSTAMNTNSHVKVTQLTHEEYMQGSTYEIDAGDYHSSGSHLQDRLSATFFSFTSKDGKVDKSYVVGPAQIQSSEINRKMQIDPSELLTLINEQINQRI